MSAKAVKATNRDIRKAFGTAAIETIGAIRTAVDNQGLALTELLKPEGTLDAAAARVTAIEARLDAAEAALSRGVRERGLGGRLIWLVLGR